MPVAANARAATVGCTQDSEKNAGAVSASTARIAAANGVPSSTVPASSTTNDTTNGRPVAAIALAAPIASPTAGNVAAYRKSAPASASASAWVR